MIGADAKLGPTKSLDEVSQGWRIVDKRVVIKAPRLFSGRPSTWGWSDVAPTEHQARQREGKPSAAMANGNPQPAVPLQDAAGDQRTDRECGFTGKGQELDQ